MHINIYGNAADAVSRDAATTVDEVIELLKPLDNGPQDLDSREGVVEVRQLQLPDQKVLNKAKIKFDSSGPTDGGYVSGEFQVWRSAVADDIIDRAVDTYEFSKIQESRSHHVHRQHHAYNHPNVEYLGASEESYGSNGNPYWSKTTISADEPEAWSVAEYYISSRISSQLKR